MPHAKRADQRADHEETADPYRPQGRADLFVAAGLTLLAALVVMAEPQGSMLRLWVTLPMLFFVPGYLLIQTLVVPAPPLRGRLVQAVASMGVSPALVGLLALFTTVLPGGIQAGTIVATVTVVSLGLTVAAYMRRSFYERPLRVKVPVGARGV